MKLLVTTDFSANSKGAIRFAQTLAKQSKNVEVVFYHAVHIMKPALWSITFFEKFMDEEIKRLSEDLKKFIDSILIKDTGVFATMKFVVENCASTKKDIIKYTAENQIDFICIATKGAGLLRKVMGTHTSYIVNKSKVPVLVIPSHYRAKTLKNASYLSDFENLENELKKITKFSTEISMQIEVLHYSSIEFNKNRFEKNIALFKTKKFKNTKLNIQKSTLELSLVEKVANYVQKSKPQLLIMFTKREKSFFETIFIPSKSVELTYSTKVPVLIYSK